MWPLSLSLLTGILSAYDIADNTMTKYRNNTPKHISEKQRMRRSLSKHRGYGIWNWCSQGGMGEYIVLKKQNRKPSQSHHLQQYAIMMCNKCGCKLKLMTHTYQVYRLNTDEYQAHYFMITKRASPCWRCPRSIASNNNYLITTFLPLIIFRPFWGFCRR